MEPRTPQKASLAMFRCIKGVFREIGWSEKTPLPKMRGKVEIRFIVGASLGEVNCLFQARVEVMSAVSIAESEDDDVLTLREMTLCR